MPWLQKYVTQGFKIYASIITFLAIFCLCRKNGKINVNNLLFDEEHDFTTIVFIHFCILLTVFCFLIIGRLIFGSLLAREWSNSGYTEQINLWIFYRLVFLCGVLDIWSSLRPFLWWCWWFVIILHLRFFILACKKRLNFLQTQDNTDLHGYSKRIYRVWFFLLVITIISLLVISVSISTLIGDVQQEYLFRTLTNSNEDLQNLDLLGDIPNAISKPPNRFRRLYKNLKFMFKYVLDLLGMDDHEPIMGPRMTKFIEKSVKLKQKQHPQSNVINVAASLVIDPSEINADNYHKNVDYIEQRTKLLNDQLVKDTADILGLIQAIFFTLGDTIQVFVESFYMFLKHTLYIMEEKLGTERRKTFLVNHWLTYCYEMCFYSVVFLHNLHLLVWSFWC